jgi:hypothetical protein
LRGQSSSLLFKRLKFAAARLVYEAILGLQSSVEDFCGTIVDVVGRLLRPVRGRVYRLVAGLEAERLAEAIASAPEGWAEAEYADAERVIAVLEEQGFRLVAEEDTGVGFDLLLVSTARCRRVRISWRVVSPEVTRLTISWSPLEEGECR